MRSPSISHRLRIALTTSALSGLLLAIVFFGITTFFRDTERTGMNRSLQASLQQLVHDIQGGQLPDIAELHDAHPSQTFAVYDSTGELLRKIGSMPIELLQGYGSREIGGREVFYRSAKAKTFTIVGAVDMAAAQDRQQRLNITLSGLWLFLIILIGLVTWYAAKATFRPLFELTQQAAQTSGRDLSFRLDTKDRAEFASFTRQLNSLLDRVAETAEKEEQFASDAAHELRTPLAILRGKVESTLLNPRSPAEYQSALYALIPEIDRLTGIVEMLLRSARAAHDDAPVTEVSAVVEESTARWLDQFETKGIHLQVATETAYATIWPEELQCVVDNFLNNALKVSPVGTTCIVALERNNGHVVLRVDDEGPGIPEEMLDKVFERFTRGEASRNRASGGFGIGLAVCKNIVDSRGGTISAQNLERGAEFKVELQTANP